MSTGDTLLVTLLLLQAGFLSLIGFGVYKVYQRVKKELDD